MDHTAETQVRPKARQKVNASTLEIQLLCLQEQLTKKKKKNPEEFRKEKSSLMGAEFHRSYFELHQPAGDPGKADFPLPGTL